MSIVGLGTDIVKIARLGAQQTQLNKLAERVLTPKELAQFKADKYPERLLAKRFAAKEAAVKALGTGIGNGVGWQQIEIIHNEFGAPIMQFSGAAANRASALGATQIYVSIADEQEYAVATVVLS